MHITSSRIKGWHNSFDKSATSQQHAASLFCSSLLSCHANRINIVFKVRPGCRLTFHPFVRFLHASERASSAVGSIKKRRPQQRPFCVNRDSNLRPSNSTLCAAVTELRRRASYYHAPRIIQSLFAMCTRITVAPG